MQKYILGAIHLNNSNIKSNIESKVKSNSDIFEMCLNFNNNDNNRLIYYF